MSSQNCVKTTGNCIKSVEYRSNLHSNFENYSTPTERCDRSGDGKCDSKMTGSGPAVEEEMKFETCEMKSEIKTASRSYSREKPIHTYFGKSKIGPTNPQPIKKMSTQAKLKSSFKATKPRKYRQISISSNSKIMDYFKIESAPNLDLLRQSDQLTCVLTDPNIADD